MHKIFLYIFCVFIAAGCSKEKVVVPDFEISTESGTYKVGDTITFNFSGKPDNITFYSGEPGHNFDYRSRTVADNDLQIEFKTLVQYAVIYDNLKLLVSTDFNGIYSADNLKLATWTDISDRATFSAGQDNVSSGVISLKPYVRDNSLLYVAFHYTDYKKSQGQNRWIIRTFTADKISPEGVVSNLATMATGGWKGISLLNSTQVWTISSTQLLMYGGTAANEDNDDWVISKGFDFQSVEPDLGIALKNVSTRLDSYQHVYTEPGTYKVVFEASSVRYNGEKRVVKELSLQIMP
ncbi:DUF5017 domain-containing protein [Arcticibacter tournemirensis]|nr:DUF5017 domain-containing protein [Arcticibacter tournemirensis]